MPWDDRGGYGLTNAAPIKAGDVNTAFFSLPFARCSTTVPTALLFSLPSRLTEPLLMRSQVLIMPEALTHGVLPWMMLPGRARQLVLFRYEPQYSGSVPEQLPAAVEARLSEETLELMQYAHITHTKKVALGWREHFYSGGGGGGGAAAKL